MIEEEGVVTGISGDIAQVSIVQKNACAECASAGICHPDDKEFMEASNPLGAKKGQRVKIVLAPQIYLKASIILYGIPMAALLAGAIIAKHIAIRAGAESQSDLWAFAAGITCTIISFLFIRLYNRKVENTPEYKPVIVEILS